MELHDWSSESESPPIGDKRSLEILSARREPLLPFRDGCEPHSLGLSAESTLEGFPTAWEDFALFHTDSSCVKV